MKGEKRGAAGFLARNSLFRNTLPISHLNSKTWRKFPPNPMIPIDRGEGGYHHN
jgi:hypothetical protein